MGDDFLCRIGVEVLQIRLGVGRDLLVRQIRVDPGDGRFGADARRRVDDLEFVFVLGDLPQGLILPGQVDIADFLDRKADGGATRTGIGDRDVAHERLDKAEGLLVAAAARGHRTPGGEHTQFAVARGAGVGRHDRDALFAEADLLDLLSPGKG